MFRCKNPIIILLAFLFILFGIAIIFILKDFKAGDYSYQKDFQKNVGSFDGSARTANNNSQNTSAKQAQADIIHFTNFGDIMFDRLIKTDLAADKNPFVNLAGPDWDFLRQTDFNVANLEGPISTTTHCQKKSINFEFNPSVAPLIASTGFKLLNLANNHSYDCYIEGAQDTAKYLSANGIDYFGGEYVDKPYTIKEIKGKKIAFVGFYAVLPSADIASMTKMIKQLKFENDLVVIDVHWGEEYKLHSNVHQEQVAHQWVDAGADIIIGHHPHVIEETEIYKGKPIFYSLGNFVFDQNFGDTTTGLGVEITLANPVLSESAGKNSIILHPFNLINRQPTLMSAENTQKFCAKYLASFPKVPGCQIQY